MMAGVTTVCEDCEGRRFQASVLDYRLGGLNIAEVLDLSVEDAVGFFGAGEARTPAAHAILQRMADVGLGYLRLGQPLTTLSGGERQRLKLATHMGADGGVYVLDEPTTGLHLADLEQLLGLLDRLVDSGKSVIVIEHHQAVMAHADWIIDLGPGAGHDGGRIVFEGTPADLVAAKSTLTGEHLAAFVGRANKGGRKMRTKRPLREPVREAPGPKLKNYITPAGSAAPEGRTPVPDEPGTAGGDAGRGVGGRQRRPQRERRLPLRQTAAAPDRFADSLSDETHRRRRSRRSGRAAAGDRQPRACSSARPSPTRTPPATNTSSASSASTKST